MDNPAYANTVIHTQCGGLRGPDRRYRAEGEGVGTRQPGSSPPRASDQYVPYYQDDSVTIYHGDCREILPLIPGADLVLTDPPYGVGIRTTHQSSGRGKPSSKSTHVGRNRIARANDYPAVYGDDVPFDPAHLLRFPRLVVFGAQHFADKLPLSGAWIVWNRESGGSDTADAELAWTNLGGTIRMFTYQWNGACRHGEKETHGWHPTQKPVALMAWILERWTDPGDLILDPYAGSGPVLRAAKDLRRQAIGIEIEERYCEIAARRCQQEVLPLESVV